MGSIDIILCDNNEWKHNNNETTIAKKESLIYMYYYTKIWNISDLLTGLTK